MLSFSTRRRSRRWRIQCYPVPDDQRRRSRRELHGDDLSRNAFLVPYRVEEVRVCLAIDTTPDRCPQATMRDIVTERLMQRSALGNSRAFPRRVAAQQPSSRSTGAACDQFEVSVVLERPASPTPRNLILETEVLVGRSGSPGSRSRLVGFNGAPLRSVEAQSCGGSSSSRAIARCGAGARGLAKE
jgi:hypothetical protein